MRIRKNAKWSSLQLLGGGDSSVSHSSGVDDGGGGHLLQLLLQPHVCQLNQSPWDAPDSPLALLQHHQREDSFTGTVNSLNDSAPTQDSFPDELEPTQKEKLIVKGKKVIGAGTATRRKKSRKGGGSLGNYDNATTVTKGGEAATSHHRKRKKGAAANPYEFYYYTGFGPSWRKRGANGEDRQKGNFSIVTDNISSITDNASYTTKFVDGDNMMDMDMVEVSEDDDEESSGGGGDGDGKKRMRKPVKARSLKSLM